MKLVRGFRPLLGWLRCLSAVLGAATALVVAWAMAAQAQTEADLTLPVSETFTGPVTTTDGGWSSAGKPVGTWSPQLTGTTTSPGWLELTPASSTLSGIYYLNNTFPSDLGVVVTFQYAMYGGDCWNGSTSSSANCADGYRSGDGFSFFLIDGSEELPITAGQSGGALGYGCGLASGVTGPSPCTEDGVPGAYMGVGFDEYGGFASDGVGNDDPALGSGSFPARISVRGSWDGSMTTGYRLLRSQDGETVASVPGPGDLGTLTTGDPEVGDAAGTTGVRTVRISIARDPVTDDEMLSVASNTGIYTDGTPSPLEPLITNFDLTTSPDQMEDLPPTLRMGFAASTGGSTNNHLIRNLTVTAPTDLVMEKTADLTSVNPGQTITYTLHITNNYTNSVDGATVVDNVEPDGGLTDVSWTCEPSTGSDASCEDEEGTGNVSTTVSFEAERQGDSVDIVITGTVSPIAGGGTLTNTATIEPPDNRAQLIPARNTGSVSTTVGPAVLTITVPDNASLPDTTPGVPTDGAIGPVTVSDYRGVAEQSWTATVWWTEFTGPTPIGPDQIGYRSGNETETEPEDPGDLHPGQPDETDPEPLPPGGSLIAFLLEDGTAANSVTWNPTLVVNVPYGTGTGGYTGIVYHSVA